MIRKSMNKGFTLIELLIAMAIGLLLVSAVLTLYVSMAGSNIDYLKSIRLNHELRSVMSLMVRDLRRAGHNRDAATDSVAASTINPFSNSSAGAVQATVLTVTGTSTANQTITFSYEKDTDAQIDTFGYRLNVDGNGIGAVEYCNNDSATGVACTNWEDITDPNLIDIDSLDITQDTSTVASGTFVIRQVTISLTGHLISDTDFTKTISEVVKIRNDHSPNWAM